MEVTQVRCLVSRAGSIAGHFNADMVFISGVPHVVFEGSVSRMGLKNQFMLFP